MFVLTLKWNKKIALLLVIAAAVLLCAIILSIGSGDGSSAASIKLKTNEDRIKFLQSLGWEVEETPIAEKIVVIPKDFSDVYDTYNKLQLEQGYDLSEYCGLEATIYTYTVTNYTGYTGNVVADLYVLNFELIGGDIHSLAIDGFMHGLCRK